MKDVIEIGGHKAVIAFDPETKLFRGEFIELDGGADFYAADLIALQSEGEISLKVFFDLTHEQLFGQLAYDTFTAAEAMEYLEVSQSTFRRFVASKKLVPASTVGRSQMFAVPELKAFKKALNTAKRTEQLAH